MLKVIGPGRVSVSNGVASYIEGEKPEVDKAMKELIDAKPDLINRYTLVAIYRYCEKQIRLESAV